MIPVLARWLEEVRASPGITIDAANINREAIDNLWCFSPSDVEAPTLDVPALLAFVQAVLVWLGQQLQGLAVSPMCFYVWHDVQARQLRFSLVSASHGFLPFRCEWQQAPLIQVLESVVQGDWMNSDLLTAPDSAAEACAPAFVLPVFVTPVFSTPPGASMLQT